MKAINNKKKDELYKIYPWLKITTTTEDYIIPEYYDRLLKDYIFSGKTDLQLFEKYLKAIPDKNYLSILELGCGSGRATEFFLNCFRKRKIILKMVDLSQKMLLFCEGKFKNDKNLEFIKSDSIAFLAENKDVYDLIFSLWSLSHSIHQVLIRDGLICGRKYIQDVIQKMVEKNMTKGSSFFLIHFDSISDEQKILMRQWRKVYPIYNNISTQSPSKLLIDEVLRTLEKRGIIKLKSAHYEGKEIEYSSFEEALEIFLNLHMESYFNESSLLPEVIDELVSYFENFTDRNGVIRIKPGCFIYTFTKILYNDEYDAFNPEAIK